MKLQRQLTIKSMFFLTMLVALLAASFGRVDLYKKNPLDVAIFLIFYGVLFLMPVAICLFVKERVEIIAISLVAYFAAFIFVFGHGAPAFSAMVPLVSVLNKFTLRFELWMFVLYAVLYCSIGPLFAMTCRERDK